MLPALRDAIHGVSADIVCLQEVTGAHEIHSQIENWPDRSHYEFLCRYLWSEYAYGRNAVYRKAITVMPCSPAFLLNIMKISISPLATAKSAVCSTARIVPPQSAALHLICVHLGLSARQRSAQLAMLAGRVNDLPAQRRWWWPAILTTWRQQANRGAKVAGRAGGSLPAPWPPGENLPGASSAPAP